MVSEAVGAEEDLVADTCQRKRDAARLLSPASSVVAETDLMCKVGGERVVHGDFGGGKACHIISALEEQGDMPRRGFALNEFDEGSALAQETVVFTESEANELQGKGCFCGVGDFESQCLTATCSVGDKPP